MACFIVPMVQAIATTAYRRYIQKDSSRIEGSLLRHNIPALEKMLWGGTVMLIVDHVLSGELTWAFPFFTALTQTGGVKVFFHEILAVGIPMSLALTSVWALWAVLRTKAARA